MYRQRKRDLNLKPNRQLDKRSSRGMIYENEELRMRTIAICEDVDRGQNDIKKLRKENDHLKREIWGLRDECEKLEEMLKKVCISANIPEIQLESSSKNRDDEDDTDDLQDDESEDGSGRRAGRNRRESGTSVMTYDSEVGSCMTSMYGDEDDGRSEDIAFALDDSGSVLNQPGVMCSENMVVAEAIVEHPTKMTAFDRHAPSWGHAAIPPDLEAVREETESTMSALNSPVILSPPGDNPLGEGAGGATDSFDMLPDPNTISLPGSSTLVAEGMHHPVIHITPASSPNCSSDLQSPEILSTAGRDPIAQQTTTAQENVHNMGCIALVPKTFKVTSEILVGDSRNGNIKNGDQIETSDLGAALALANNTTRSSLAAPKEKDGHPVHTKSVQFYTRKQLPRKQDSDPTIPGSSGENPSDQIVVNHNGGMVGLGCHRKSCYLPAPGYPSTIHRSFGVLGCCCSDFLGGYQSEPSLNSPSGGSYEDDQSSSFFNSLCCRVPVPPAVPPVTLRSVWNTVDKNIVIGFYDIESGSPTVQEIIDELEAQFDHTLENISGIRLVPGRIFISLKSASIVKAFLSHFKHDLVLRKSIRVRLMEGTAKWSTLVLSGIPQELSDLAVISVLNQFGQVVAPLERRNYKGVDISERIAKMHLVISETSVPEHVSVSGYKVRIRVEIENAEGGGGVSVPVPDSMTLFKSCTARDSCAEGMLSSAPINQQQIPSKYGFVAPSPAQGNASGKPAAGGPTTGAVNSPPAPGLASSLKPHKPVIRSSSSAPRLETPGTQLPLPAVEAKRQSSVCAANIPADQHPAKLLDANNKANVPPQQKVTIAPTGQGQPQAGSTPNLQSSPKKPLARLLVSSPGSFQPTPVTSPGSPDNPNSFGAAQKIDSPPGGGGALKAFYRSFDPRRGSGQGSKFTSIESRHAQLTPSSSYSPKSRRKSSVQFANVGRNGKREPLPWCGCWGLGCG